MSESSATGGYYFQDGVWLNRGESTRSERYQKWTDDNKNSQVERLSRQQHNNLVKLNTECLEVRNELRGLKLYKRQVSRRNRSVDPNDTPKTSSQATAFPSIAGFNKTKSPSAGSLASFSSGQSSLGPAPTGAGKTSRVGEVITDGFVMRGKAVGGSGAVNGDPAVQKVKKMYSFRNLSKLKNDMEVKW